MVILSIPFRSFHFHTGFVRAGSDNNEICKLLGAFRVLVMGGFEQLSGIVEFGCLEIAFDIVL